MTTRLEGCLSILDKLVEVERVNEIEVEYFDLNGREKRRVLSGFGCAAFLHEFDHLEGILMTDDARVKQVYDKGDMFEEWREKVDGRKRYGFVGED